MGRENMSESTISIKAVLWDTLGKRLKELRNITDNGERDLYIQKLLDIVERTDSLIEKIDDLEAFRDEEDIATSSDKVSDVSNNVVNNVADTDQVIPTDNKVFDVPKSVSDNVIPTDKTSDVSKSVSDTVVDKPKMPDVFEDIFSKNVEAPQQNVVNTVPVQTNEKVEEIPVRPNVNVFEQAPVKKMTILKLKNDKVKAILVNQSQMTKLKASKRNQEALLDFGLVSNNGESVPKNNLEEMMARASALYKEGKIQEAQALYSQISLLNKSNNSNV